jgi:acyl-CoA synthetase (AMP-forming)/AMP-acid ligase II
MLNLATMLAYSAKEYAGNTAVIFGATRISYAHLSAAVNKIAYHYIEMRPFQVGRTLASGRSAGKPLEGGWGERGMA